MSWSDEEVEVGEASVEGKDYVTSVLKNLTPNTTCIYIAVMLYFLIINM